VKNGEFYVGGNYGPFSLKYFYSTTPFFSIGQGTGTSTKGSQYVDGTVTFDLGDGWGVVGHAGWQKVKGYKELGAPADSYADYKLGVTKDLSGWVLGAAVIGTSRAAFFTTSSGEDGGKTRLVASVSKTF
jgi:uncharacterized protein (TIGR02001 family)